MDKENFDKITSILDTGKINEIKKLKKESLIDYIDELADKIEKKESEIKKLSEEDSVRTEIENQYKESNEKLLESIEEYKSLILDLKKSLSESEGQLLDIETAYSECYSMSKNRLTICWVFISLFIISLIVNLTLIF